VSQLGLKRYANAAAKSAQICSIPVKWVVWYGIHREWRSVDPGWIKQNLNSIRMLYGKAADEEPLLSDIERKNKAHHDHLMRMFENGELDEIFDEQG
jgi:hypothetical protein